MSKNIDVDRAINIAVKSGKVELGARNAIRNAQLGKARLIILADNCPDIISKKIKYSLKGTKIALLNIAKTSLDLGTICGRPHRVAAITVHDPGDSKILDIVESISEAN